MKIFDKIMDEINYILDGKSNWVQRKANSNLDIEKCNGVATVDTETNSCALCVSVNKCYFINEKNKMPSLPQHIEKIKPLKEEDIIFDFPISKIYYVFNDIGSKAGLILSWGYEISDAEEIQKELIRQGKEAYAKGNYILHTHDLNGQRITTKFWLKGKRQKEGKLYFAYSGWIIYPSGKLLMATPIIRREK